MAKTQDEEAHVVKKRREVPVTVVEPADDSEESDDGNDGVMGDEFEGLSDVDSDKSASIRESESEDEDEDEDKMRDNGGIERSYRAPVVETGYSTSEGDSMEGSRSRSEEDLRDIGSARRLDDDDTAESAWKETGDPVPSLSSTPEVVADADKRAGAARGSGDGAVAVAVARGLDDGESNGEEVADAMKTDEEAVAEEEEEEGDEEKDERLGSQSEEEGEPSASEGGSDDSDRDSGGKDGDSPKSSAYSRAFSKILQSKAAKESDTGPVLAARQTLVARKLEEEAGETKEKKDTKKEKKELREKAHLYPQSFTDTKEKDLVKLATRGVVKLFNAVSKAQKVQAGADGRDAKVVAKQSKAAFLAEVKGNGTSVGSKRKLPSSSEPPFNFGTSESLTQSASRWSVTKDDFMIGKQKLKDWDKDEEMGDAAGVQQTTSNGIDDSD